MDNWVEELKNLAGDYAASGNVQLFVKTNFGPEIPIFTGSDDDGSKSVSDIIGLKAQVIVKNKNGETIKTFGEPAPTEPLKAAALIAVLIAIVYLVVV